MNELVVIPASALESEILRALIEDYVTREGTDYGHGDYSLDSKVDGVLTQLDRGTALIVFDPYLQQTNIVSAQEYHAAQSGEQNE